ncbi:MAG TPA: cephalosporin hydroxylase family protein [Anaerolineales bacterium]|nr:cephalosporin hydroxylase family protein [Anaerolineales bacterium]
MSDAEEAFKMEVQQNIKNQGADLSLHGFSNIWIRETARYKYTYNFSWLGRPIIQLPQDMMAMQEIIWQVRPQLIIETGIAHGGSLIFYASMLELIGGKGQVLGIDIDIRAHNRVQIENHPMAKRITMIEGSSIRKAVIDQVRAIAQGKGPVIVILDSNHTHDHVLKELQAYQSLVTKYSYLVVFDTLVDDMPDDMFSNRPWGKGNNPKTAVWEFLKSNDRFEVDKEIEAKLLITVAPDGYLKCIKD